MTKARVTAVKQPKRNRIDVARGAQAFDAFARAVEFALEHVGDPERLSRESPLAASYFLGSACDGRPLDKSGESGRILCELLFQASAHLDGEARELLNTAYFKRDPKQQHNGIALQLHLSDRTYFRYKADAVRALAAALVTSVLPALRTDAPAQRDMHGRGAQQAVMQQTLSDARSVYLSGPGGIGKTTLAGAVCRAWPVASARVFWYTLRLGLNDQSASFVFALAHFLRVNGAHATWRQVVADRGALVSERVSAALRFDLNALREQDHRILVCVDELDLLQPERDAHAPLLELIDSLRGQCAVLLIGQRQAVDADLHVQLGALPEADALSVARARGAASDAARLVALARGNPAQLQLLLALHGAPDGDQTRMLSAAPSLELLFGRVWRRLTPAAQLHAAQLAICRAAVPANAWLEDVPMRVAALERLRACGLIHDDARGGIQIATYAHALLLQRIPGELKVRLHAQAALLREALGEYLDAAQHWVESGQTAAAVWVLFAQRAAELERGNGPAMLALLNRIDAEAVPDKRDRETLLALRAQLGYLFGDVQQAEADGRAAVRSGDVLLQAYASEALGESLAKQGRNEEALDVYRASLDALLLSPLYRSVRLRNKAAHVLQARLNRLEDAREHALAAQLESAIMAGSVEERSGNYAAARVHYEAALALAAGSTGHVVERALLYSNFGNLLWRQGELDGALHWLHEALRLDQQRGDLTGEAWQRVNLSAVHIVAARYEDSLEEARTALRIGETLGQPDLIAGACSNAGEACVHLMRYDDAERYAQRSLSQEEGYWRPYALTVIGLCEHARGKAPHARGTLQSAVDAAAESDDAYAEAAALRALGAVHRTERQPAAARTAFERALALYQRLALTKEVGALQSELQAIQS